MKSAYGKFEIFLIGLGLALMIAGSYWTWNSYEKWKAAAQTTGTITSEVIEQDEDSELYRGIVTFRDAAGNSISFPMGSAASWRKYTIGEEVAVLYLPDGSAKVNSFSERYLGPVLVIGLGLFIIAFAFLLVAVNLRSGRRRQHLVDYGQKLEAIIIGIRKSGGGDDTAYCVILCEANTRTGKRRFESDFIFKEEIPQHQGQWITVYVDPSNESYFVDVASAKDG